MSRRKAVWGATLRRIHTGIVRGGQRRVRLVLFVNKPEAQAGRPIEVTLSPEIARVVAAGLYRSADEVDEHNRRR